MILKRFLLGKRELKAREIHLKRGERVLIVSLNGVCFPSSYALKILEKSKLISRFIYNEIRNKINIDIK